MECFPLELLNYQNKDTIKWLAKNNYKFTFLE